MKIYKLLLLFLFLSPPTLTYAQTCNPDSLQITQTRAKDTDPNISWELNKHYSFYNPTCVSNNTLLLHLVGSFDNPKNSLLFPSAAANNGFHVVSLKYENGTTAQTTCNNSTDTNCYLNFRKEILEGIDYSPDITVDFAHSVENRLVKLLQYLQAQNPNQGWGAYLNGSTILWNKMMVSGHSQGGGHAGVIALTHPVKRVIMFASPNDYSSFFNAPATWTNATKAVSDSVFYGLNNLNDDVVDFWKQYAAWGNLGMPAFGDTVNVDLVSSPYNNSRQLYTDYNISGIGGNHSAMIRDDKTPKDANGKSIYEPTWLYLLGVTQNISVTDLAVFRKPLFEIYPNPSSGKIYIRHSETAKTTVKIYSPSGALKAEFKNTLEIDLSDGKSGMYFIEIRKSGESLGLQKLILTQ